MNSRTRLEIGAAALLALIFMISILGGASAGAEGSPSPHTAAPTGTRLLARVLERTGWNVVRWGKPPVLLEGRGNVMLLPATSELSLASMMRRIADKGEQKRASKDGEGEPPSREHWQGMRNWVEQGNVVIVPMRSVSPLFDAPLSLLRDALEWDSVPRADEEGTSSTAAGLSSPERFVIRLEDLPEGCLPVLGSRDEPFAAAKSLGRGTVVVVASLEPFTNRAIRGFPENAVVLVELLERLRNEVARGDATAPSILVDTYLIGEQESANALALAVSPNFAPVTIHVALAVVLLALARCARFGSIREPARIVAHGQTEAARGIASLYRRARRPELAAAAIAQGFDARLRTALGLRPEVPVGEVATRASALLGAPAATIEAHLTHQGSINESRLLQRAVETAAFESKLHRGSHSS